jgi:hypothetical protein
MADLSCSEARMLAPVAVEIDAAKLRSVTAWCLLQGKWTAFDPKQDIPEDCTSILVQAPIPTSWISRIVLKQESDKEQLDSLFYSVNNVVADRFTQEVQESVFSEAEEPVIASPPEPQVLDGQYSISEAQGVGGILGSLFHVANRSDFGARYYSYFSGLLMPDANMPADTPADAQDCLSNWLSNHAMFKDALAWLGKSQLSDARSEIFWGMVSELIKSDSRFGKKPNSRVIGFLKEKADGLADIPTKNTIQKLLTEIKEIQGSSLSISELLEKHKGTISHAVLLFFLRNDLPELLEIISDSDIAGIDDEDAIAAAILFGARDGWIGLPIELRVSRQFSDWVAAIIARLCRRSEDGRMALGVPLDVPERILPIREYFLRETKWSKKTKEDAISICVEFKWDDYLYTELKLTKGYSIEARGKAEYLILPGHAKDSSLKREVKKGDFMNAIANKGIDDASLKAACKNYKNAVAK